MDTQEEAMFSPGLSELIIILIIVLIIFGARKLPEIGCGLGKGIRDFKMAIADNDEEDVNPFANSDLTITKGETKNET
jgi:sec-independent protein translocase protein TatA